MSGTGISDTISGNGGSDTIYGGSGNDTISFSDITNIDALSFSRKGNDLLIDSDFSGVLKKDHFANQSLENLQFSDGRTFDLSNLMLTEESEEEKSISKYISLALSIASDTAIATNDSFTNNEDNSISINFSDILSNDYDPKNSKLIFNNPSKGKIIVNSDSILD